MSSPSLHKQLLPIQRLKERLISGAFQRKKHALTLSDSQFVFFRHVPLSRIFFDYKGKGSPYSIAKRRVPELIAVLGSQVTRVINPAIGCHYFPPGLQLPSEPLRGLLLISLLGEQRHGSEQFA